MLDQSRIFDGKARFANGPLITDATLADAYQMSQEATTSRPIDIVAGADTEYEPQLTGAAPTTDTQ